MTSAQLAGARRLLESFDPSQSSRAGGSGELPGVRRTMDEMIAQEVAGGCNPAVAEAQVRGIAREYDRRVATGHEPPPRRRD